MHFMEARGTRAQELAKMSEPIDTALKEYVPGRIWLKKYPVQYAGCYIFARATFIRLSSGDILVH